MKYKNRLSVLIPTKNESAKIADCIMVFKPFVESGSVEVIVVDNYSDDNTQSIAAECGAKVIVIGPERSSQRNQAAKEAAYKYVLFVDADMVVPESTTGEILDLINSENPPDALFIPEIIVGSGWFTKVRNFERPFYNETCIDGLRVISKAFFDRVGGYDENMYAAEDWDLDRRLIGAGCETSITNNPLYHNEGDVSLKTHITKKSYYAGNLDYYRNKWNNDAIIKKQLGVRYRFFGVFVENGKWKKSIARPHMMIAFWAYKFLVGMAYLSGRK